MIFVGKLSNNLAVRAVFLAQYIFTQSQVVIFVVVVFFRSDINVQDGKHCNTYDVVTFEAHGDIPRCCVMCILCNVCSLCIFFVCI